MTPQTILALSLRVAAAETRDERNALAAEVGALLLRLIGVRIRARAYDSPIVDDPSTGAHYTFPCATNQTLSIGELLAMLDVTLVKPEGGAQ